VAVAGGAEALAELRRAVAAGRPYGLILLDMMMPGLDGEQTARAINADPGCGQAPILVLTSVDQRGQAGRLAELGVAGVLLKPLKRDLLHQAVLAVLGRAADDGDERADGGSRSRAPLVTRESLTDGRQLRVLLVEDKPFNRRVAEGFLARRGIGVTGAGDGGEALALFRGQRFDLVLMDVQMPVMDGFEATRRMRALEDAAARPRHTPIIAMTAHAMAGDREQCLLAGMDDYVSKPIDPTRLYAVIQRWTGTLEPAAAGAGAGEDGRPADGDRAGCVRPSPAVGAEQPSPEAGAPPSLDASHAEPAGAGADPTARLRALFGGDDAAVEELVAIFIDDAPAAMEELATALAAGDASAAKTSAHAAKGLLRNFGLEAEGHVLLQIEQAADAGDLARAQTLLIDARRRLDDLLATLRARLREPAT
jgi:CheY-like chemotaxis protein/HPt (histidine-containing phosphotransfer) domain-containing protein